MDSQNRAQLAARAGRSSSGHEGSLVTFPLTSDNPHKPTFNLDLGWAELTDIRVFVGLDDLRQFKVPRDDGHLGWEDGGGSATPKLPIPVPWWLLGLLSLGVGGPRFGPCPRLTLPPVCPGLRDVLGHRAETRRALSTQGCAGHSTYSLNGPSTHHLSSLSHGSPLPPSCHPPSALPSPLHLVLPQALHCHLGTCWIAWWSDLLSLHLFGRPQLSPWSPTPPTHFRRHGHPSI